MYTGTAFKTLPNRPHWRSVVLRPTSLVLLLIAELALLAAIIDFWALSAIRHGFINIGLRSSTSTTNGVSGTFDRARPLLWTTLPTVVLSFYRLLREAVVSALVVETPFIELYKSSATQPTKIRKSIYVDYRTTFGILAWYKAIKNSHVFLGICMLFSFVVSLTLVPLAGGLFTEGLQALSSPATVEVLSTFNSSVSISLQDYGALFDAVSASWINTASFPAGTDGRFPLPTIRPTQDLQNYTISTQAETSQLTLDCKLIEDATMTAADGTNKIVQTSFEADDRDCRISGDILTTKVATPSIIYVKAYSKTNCPSWAGHTRAFLLFVNTTSSGEWQDHILISCIPSYWTVNGLLNVVGMTDSIGRSLQTPSFTESLRKIEELPSGSRPRFEDAVMNVETINIGSDVNTASRFSELVYRYLDSRSLKVTSRSLIDATSTIYGAIYTMLCVDNFFPVLEQSARQDGLLSITENRLHVVEPVAIAMTVIFVLLIIETIYLIIYLHKHPSILAEESIGLVGAANLIHDSNLACLVARRHDDPAFDGRLRRRFPDYAGNKKEKYLFTDDEILDRNCWVERDGISHALRIVVEASLSDDECDELLHGHRINRQIFLSYNLVLLQHLTMVRFEPHIRCRNRMVQTKHHINKQLSMIYIQQRMPQT